MAGTGAVTEAGGARYHGVRGLGPLRARDDMIGPDEGGGADSRTGQPRTRFTRLPIAEIVNPEFQFVLDLWTRKRADRIAPARAEFDPAELKPVLPRVLLIEVLPGEPVDFRYRLAGTEAYDIHGLELTGRLVSELEPADFAERLRRDLLELVATREPQHVRIDFTNREGNTRSLAVLRLPLSGDGRDVDMILVIQDFGTDPAKLQQIMREVLRMRN